MVVRDNLGSCLSGFIWSYIVQDHEMAQGDDGKSSLHMHAVPGLRLRAQRVPITETVEHVRRRRRAGPGIALISI